MSAESDNVILMKSMTPIDQTFNFENKQYIFQTDQNNGSYPTGQIIFDLSSFSNQNRYLDWSNAFLAIPLVMTLNINLNAGNAGFSSASFENDFAMSLKNGYHQLINSVQVQITNNDVVQVQNYSNLAINYELLSTLSQDDVQNFGSTFGFFGKDDAESIQYEGVGGVLTGSSTAYRGIGEINNIITPSSTGGWSAASGWGSYIGANMGRRNRMICDTSFDPKNTNATVNANTASTVGTFITQSNCGAVAKNFCDSTTSGSTAVVYYIMATIPLKIIHDIFDKMHLTKNMYMRLIVNTHTQCYSTLTIGGTTGATTANLAPYFNTFSTVSQYSTVPYQISQLSATTASGRGLNLIQTTNVSTTIIASIGIGSSYNSNVAKSHPSFANCRIYVPTYTLSPQEEVRYLDAVPQKTIRYLDRLTYNGNNLLNIAPGSYCNTLLNNGVSRLRAMLIIPQLSSAIHGSPVASLGGTTFVAGTYITSTLGTPMNSPFSSSPGTCCPFARVSNFNVALSGVNWYQSNINYGFEQFQNELRHANAHNGGEILGSSSGLITKSDWENAYGYIYVNFDRRPDQQSDDVSRSVQLSFQNASNVTCDYYVVLYYQREITISTSTGALVI